MKSIRQAVTKFLVWERSKLTSSLAQAKFYVLRWEFLCSLELLCSYVHTKIQTWYESLNPADSIISSKDHVSGQIK